MMDLNAYFWEERYLDDQTGWDLGGVAPPLKAYFDQLEDKQQHILIPGAGNAYEGEYLHRNGFKNVWLCDVAPSPFRNLLARVPNFPERYLLTQDFFDLEGQYDLIIEQTFFCALLPELRPKYVAKMFELLKPGGQLVGLLFNAPMNTDQPPFGGDLEEYSTLFQQHFHDVEMSACYNSIPPRAGRELFIRVRK